jgi:hypothetical protein
MSIIAKIDENGRTEIDTPVCKWCFKPLTTGPLNSDGDLHKACVEEIDAAIEEFMENTDEIE